MTISLRKFIAKAMKAIRVVQFGEPEVGQADPSSDPTIPAILPGYSLSNEGVRITSQEVLENPTDAESLPKNRPGTIS